MANWDNHLRQAEHNERLAAQLNADLQLRHWDWLITIAFYAAVHYVEAAFFFIDEIVHTETACKDTDRHAFRATQVRHHLGDGCWRSYRKLQIASYNVRYLALAEQQPANTAIQYYPLDEARRFYTMHLAQVRQTVKDRLAQ